MTPIRRNNNNQTTRGYAYESKGSVYFRVSKFPEYGKLAWLDFEGMVDGASEVARRAQPPPIDNESPSSSEPIATSSPLP